MSAPDEEADVDGVTRTAAGDVRGVEEDGIWAFRGIPFASDPSGPNRWRRPRPTDPWNGILEADKFGFIAPQPPAVPAMSIPGDPSEMSEDCLNLNVWTPAVDDAARPVLVWIHGGSFTSGSGSSLLYRGHRLCNIGNVVVVTLNYRLGALGFLAHPTLEDPEGGWANWGMFDQVAALEWVRENIAAFGGDPHNVTLFGESAGAMSITALLGSPEATGLFHAAIIQSGPPACGSESWALRRWGEFVSKLGPIDGIGTLDAGSSARQLVDVPENQLVATAARLEHEVGGLPLPYLPVIDGGILELSPADAARKGVGSRVPVIIGTNRDECSFFALGDLRAQRLNQESLLRRMSILVSPELASPLIETYGKVRSERGETTDPLSLWAAMTTDLVFRMPSLAFAEILRSQGVDAFVYLFTWESPFFGGILGSAHALDIPFVFGSVHEKLVQPFSGGGEKAEAVANAMMRSWIAFARTKDPSCDELGEWPVYGDARPTMILGESSGLEADPRGREREAWASHGVDMANRLFHS